MKKFSKMLALGMALSLAFGVTAFAANSPAVGDANLGGKVEVTPEGLEEGQEIVVGKTSETYVNKAQNIIQYFQEAFTDVITVGDGKKAVPKEVATVFEVSLEKAGNEVEVGPNGVTLTFNFTGFDVAKKYAVLHFTSEYVFEVLPATVTPDGVKATFTSLSPVAIVEVGEEAADNNNNNNNNNNNTQDSSTSDSAKSPQTGEVLPVAGIIALICLAGAAVCFGKVRYSKQ